MERIDTLKHNGLKIVQDDKKFCFGIDAVLLSEYARASIKRNHLVLDLCTGNAILPLMLSDTNAKRIYGIEIQKSIFDMAQKSIGLNGLTEKISILHGDIKKTDDFFQKNIFDVITCNPPYMKKTTGKISYNEEKAVARTEIKCNLEDVVKAVSMMLKDKGKFFMIHRPERLTEIIIMLDKYKMYIKNLKIVYPSVDKEACMILMEARKNSRVELKLLNPIIVYE
jgi:tRNA1Val (adenine37-N6)-methyltransferase